jgi:hypothetical protein
MMGEYREGNLLGEIKHDLPIINMNGSTPKLLQEYFHKQEALMIEYRIAKVDLCFCPSWEQLDTKSD